VSQRRCCRACTTHAFHWMTPTAPELVLLPSSEEELAVGEINWKPPAPVRWLPPGYIQFPPAAGTKQARHGGRRSPNTPTVRCAVRPPEPLPGSCLWPRYLESRGYRLLRSIQMNSSRPRVPFLPFTEGMYITSRLPESSPA